jgi:hypothetical protein
MPDTSPDRLREALAQHLPALRAIPAEKLIKPRLDIAAAGSKLLGHLPRYQALLPQLLALSHTNKGLIEELPTRAMAMVQAQAEYLIASTPPSDFPDLLARATLVRKQLLDSAPGLVAFNLLDGPGIEAVRKGSGHLDVAMDLLALAGIYRAAEKAIGTQSPITPAFVATAQSLGDELLTALGGRDAASRDTAETTVLRDAAYTHFMESYWEARRSLDYLLGDRDEVDLILPSIFSYKRGAKAEPVEPGKPGDA